MAGIQEYSSTPASNTTINSINIAEGCNPGNMNNAERQMMADIKTSYLTLSKTAAYTVATEDMGKTLLGDASGGAFTFTLPAAATAGNGFKVSFIKTDSGSNAVTVDGNGSETINGATTYELADQYDRVTIITDGSEWFILEDNSNVSTVPSLGSSHSSATGTGSEVTIVSAGTNTAGIRVVSANVYARANQGDNGNQAYVKAGSNVIVRVVVGLGDANEEQASASGSGPFVIPSGNALIGFGTTANCGYDINYEVLS